MLARHLHPPPSAQPTLWVCEQQHLRLFHARPCCLPGSLPGSMPGWLMQGARQAGTARCCPPSLTVEHIPRQLRVANLLNRVAVNAGGRAAICVRSQGVPRLGCGTGGGSVPLTSPSPPLPPLSLFRLSVLCQFPLDVDDT